MLETSFNDGQQAIAQRPAVQQLHTAQPHRIHFKITCTKETTTSLVPGSIRADVTAGGSKFADGERMKQCVMALGGNRNGNWAQRILYQSPIMINRQLANQGSTTALLVKGQRPTQHKTGHFRDVPQANPQAHIQQSKQKQMYYNTK